MTTSARKPPEKPSDEADRHQIAMAKKEGAAYHASLKYMTEEVADSGAMKRAGDYIVAYAQERAEGMYMLKGEGKLEWDAPTGENCHLEISVSDAGDQRFIPYLEITATLTLKLARRLVPSSFLRLAPRLLPLRHKHQSSRGRNRQARCNDQAADIHAAR